MKKRLFAVLMCLLLVFSSAAAQTAPCAPEEMSAEQLLALRQLINQRLRAMGAYPFVSLKQGAKGEEVEALQARLAELGYFTKAADGSYNSSVASAMRAFEKQNGLKQNGSASTEDQKLLYAAEAVPKPTPAPSPTPKPTATPKALSKYKTFDFEAAGLEPDKHKGELYAVSGRLLQVIQDENGLRLRLATEGEHGKIVYVTASEQALSLAEGERVLCCGAYQGLFYYQSLEGNEVSLPWINAEWVEKL